MIIREMTSKDYPEVFALWQITSKRALNRHDSEEQIKFYLQRNEGLSQVAVVDGKIVGTVLAGHDGRQGLIHHMAVLPQFRREGIAHCLAERAVRNLCKVGIDTTHIFCFCDNEAGHGFWEDFGFKKRDDVDVFSYTEES